MYDGQTVGVVIPAYNEAGFVGRVIETLPEIVDRAYVVDDCSTDDTWSEIEAAAAAVNDRSAASGTPRPFPAAVGGTSLGTRGASDGDGSSDGEISCAELVAPSSNPALHTDGGRVRADDEQGSQTESPLSRTDQRRTDGASSDQRADAAIDGDRNETPDDERADGPFHPRVVAVRHERNRGVGGAVKSGYRLARVDDVDVVGVMNGDGQMDPAIFERIVEPVAAGRAGYAKGDRLSNPDHRAPMPRWRLFGNAVLTLLTKCVSGYWGMNDPQNGYTAISSEALASIDVDRLYDGYGFCNDVLVHLNVANVRIEDVPMAAKYGDEQSHISLASFVPTLSWLLAKRASWRYANQYVLGGPHPLAAVIGLGVLASIIGIAGLGVEVATGGPGIDGLVTAASFLAIGALCLALLVAGDRLVSDPLGPDGPRALGGEQS
ncbi:glycosyltransferase family 2 protein [Halovivax limisalsi]|uniref:glycosyltransferase family 2 protein n=1 Tax=Halovivax limisalsi TaxID=1453760 RepID=UPI001FFD5BDA|nr:glycosyltransferase family 2 protein [Halovivax limisalsi]